jgi:hypothetical protein
MKPTLSIGIGIGIGSLADDTLDTIPQRADEALCRSKREGRNRVRVAALCIGDDEPPGGLIGLPSGAAARSSPGGPEGSRVNFPGRRRTDGHVRNALWGSQTDNGGERRLRQVALTSDHEDFASPALREAHRRHAAFGAATVSTTWRHQRSP